MGSLKRPRASGVSLLSEVDSAEMQAIFIIPSDWRVVKAKSAKIPNILFADNLMRTQRKSVQGA
jgi:hypothetical protein